MADRKGFRDQAVFKIAVDQALKAFLGVAKSAAARRIDDQGFAPLYRYFPLPRQVGTVINPNASRFPVLPAVTPFGGIFDPFHRQKNGEGVSQPDCEPMVEAFLAVVRDLLPSDNSQTDKLDLSAAESAGKLMKNATG